MCGLESERGKLKLNSKFMNMKTARFGYLDRAEILSVKISPKCCITGRNCYRVHMPPHSVNLPHPVRTRRLIGFSNNSCLLDANSFIASPTVIRLLIIRNRRLMVSC